MHQELQTDYQNHVARNRRKRFLKKAVSIMGCLVVFCTTYALILPAITMENKAYCGMEEHTHTEACYTQTSANVLVCSADDYVVHTHEAGCFGENGVVLCGQADYLVHSHDTLCYDANGVLVCTLPERQAHVHGENCYVPGETQPPVAHVHSESCYVSQQGALICETEEYEGHTHGSDCYAVSDQLRCALAENHVHQADCYTYPLLCNQSTEPHVHGDGCYGTGNLLCSTQEGHVHSDGCWNTVLACSSQEEGHEHGGDCYTTTLVCSIPENHAHGSSCYESVVICGREAGQAHSHDSSCYSTEAVLICETPENHVHDASCYHQTLICSVPEDPGHTHGDDCYQWNDVLACGLEEGEPEPTEPAEPVLICTEPTALSHVHTETCFELVQQENTPKCGLDHEHTEECYDLCCGLTEHTHNMACWSDPEADVESPSVWEATFAHVQLTGNWNEDVIAIAKTQLGYTESTRNYTVWEDDSIHGYTRYGAWYGVPHGDWCGMFASFCIYYADVQGMPLNYGVRPWIEDLTALKLYHSAEVYEPKTGDLIFYDWEGDGLSDHVGLVAEVIPATAYESAKVKAIEGNSSNCVQYVSYDLGDDVILGYSELPVNEELYLCGNTAHVHNEYCAGGCSRTEHIHTDDCLTEPTVYYCGLEEHTHTDECLDEEGNLICGMTEHVHTEACTVQPPVYYCGLEEHTHTDACYENGILVCTKQTHLHTEACLVEVIYYCGLEAHTHGEGCYDEAGNLICTLEEHVHTQECTEKPAYICGLEEHTHGEGCYDADGNLICTIPEHTHTDACLPTVYLCGLAEHVHGEGCYDEAGNLICTIPEHTHTPLCLGYTCGMEEHTHIAECYDAEGNLICMLEEHQHDSRCDNYICGIIPHTHRVSCYDAEGNLICSREEHTHCADCLAFTLSYEDETITVALTITGVEDLPEDLQLKVWPVAQEESPATFSSMSDAVRTEMATEDHYVSGVGIYEMQLLQADAVYTLPETAVVDVDVRFTEPLFTNDEVAVSEGMQAFTLTPDPYREYEYVEEPVPEEPQEEEIWDEPDQYYGIPMSAGSEDTGRTGIIQAVPLALRSWKDSFLGSHVAYALEDLDENPDGEGDTGNNQPEDNSGTGDISGSKTPAYNAAAADDETITNTNIGITGVSFRSNSVSAFAVALTSETAEGNFWKRVNSTSDLESGGTYMIVSSDGNYALSSANTNYSAVQIQAVKGNVQYFTISGDTDNNLRWTITGSNGSYTIRNVGNTSRYLRISYNSVIGTSSGTVSLSSGNYSTAGYGPFWNISNSSNRLYNEGGQFKMSYSVSNRETRNMLIFKLVNTTLTIPSDVTGSSSGNTGTTGSAPDPNAYQTFTNPGELKIGIDATAVTDDTGSVVGSYYSDIPTSDIEWEFRIHTGDAKADFEAHHANDGKVLTDKSVIYGDDAYNAFASYDPNTFGVTLSTLGQAYQLPQQDLVQIPVDVVFVLDVSGSMRSNNRIQTLVSSVNTSMKKIMDANDANRVGIALYSSGSMQLLPLDRYTANNNNYIQYETSGGSPTGGILTTGTLKNSAGTSYANRGENGFDGLGTFTQAGIASGYEIFAAVPQGVANNKGTKYTVTLGEGDTQREHTVERQPVFVLVTDGEPTHCTNVYNDPLNGPYYGNGLSNANPDSSSCNAKGIMGYYPGLTANYYKRMISIHYDNPVLFYTIGMGIAESGSNSVDDNSEYDGYKRAVLNPASINDAANSNSSSLRYGDTTLNMMRNLLNETVGDTYGNHISVGRNNNSCGSWVYDLNGKVPVLKDHPYNSNYAYADAAFFNTALDETFDKILTSSTKTNPYGFILYEARSSVELTDNIGEGMEIKGLVNKEDGTPSDLAPQLLYGSTRYAPTSVETANGVTTITYTGSHKDSLIPNRTINLTNIRVTVTTDASGNQIIRMFVPDIALPVYIPDSTASFYYEALPVRLIYQVGLTEASEQAVLDLRKTGGTKEFYTNRWSEDGTNVATSVLLPHEENPYYFEFERDPVTGEVDKESIKVRDNLAHHEHKTENPTGTYSDVVSCSIAKYETTVTNTHLLGNNGKLVFTAEVMDIPVEKTWTDVPETIEQPGQAQMTLYKVTEPETTGAVPKAEAVKSLTLTADTDPAWKGAFEGLEIPGSGWFYAIAETPLEGYEITYTGGEIITVSVDDPESEDDTRIQIQAVKVTVTTENDTTAAGTISVDNRYIYNYALPKTGGTGTPLYYVTGMLLCAIAVTGYMFQANNRKTKRERG